MADFIKLTDGAVFEIEEGASLGNIVCKVASGEQGIAVSKKFTTDNVTHVEFYSSIMNAEMIPVTEPSGVYENLKVESVHFDVNEMQVLINLSEKSEVELRLDAIEEEQEEQNEAIDYLAMEE